MTEENTRCKYGHETGKNKYGRCIECTRISSRKWKEKNRERTVQYAAEWRRNNPEKLNALKQRENEKKRNAVGEEREKIRQKNREWQRNNPDKVREINRIRIAFKRGSTPAWADKEEIKRIYRECPKGMQVDHIIPTKGKIVCGLHVETNLQYLTPEENMKKFISFDETELLSATLTAPTNIKKAS